ncbi:MAG: SDR family oxidoreductase [Pyrinomonadaceae bacterium]|nr:SDR family oxidoreductase [Pyrinomonadaceae bacterium]
MPELVECGRYHSRFRKRALTRITPLVPDRLPGAWLGAALAIQAVLPALRKTTGRASVVLFASVAALQGFTFHASISMAKGAVDGLTLSLAAELEAHERTGPEERRYSYT